MNYEIVETKLNPKYCVVWLHGLGANGHDFVDMVNHLDIPLDDIRFIFPHAEVMPVTINMGMQMRAWYDVKSLDADGLNRSVDVEGINNSIFKLNSLIDKQIVQGITSENIILIGFSQGGVVAIYTTLISKRRIGGLIALSTYLPAWNSFEDHITDANKGVSILVCHGTHDQVLPEVLGQGLSAQLQLQGFKNEYKSYHEMQHNVCPQEILDISNFLKTFLRDKD